MDDVHTVVLILTNYVTKYNWRKDKMQLGGFSVVTMSISKSVSS